MRRALALVVVFFLVGGSASAATTLDIRGHWHCCTQATGGAVDSEWMIAALDFNTGEWSGYGYGGPYTWPMNGTITGDQLTATVPYYNELRTYSSSFTATISANSRIMSGSWSDNRGQGGTFGAAKAAGPPPPVVGKSVNAKIVSGKVLVKIPPSTKFLDLTKVAVQLPVGTVVDATNGRIQLTAAQSLASKKVATAAFYRGIFRIGQKAVARPVTVLTIVGGDFSRCGKTAASRAHAAKKTKVRELWGAGKGLFRTSGKYSSATIRGTTWGVTDYCDGTLTKVTKGAVTVRDFKHKRNVVVKAPHSYFAKAP